MSTPLLQVRDLRLSFGEQTVVKGIAFDIEAGQKLALVGESGSGKSVTALALLGLAQGARVSGQALLQMDPGPAQDLLALSEQQLRGLRGSDIAMVFQEPMTALNPLFSVGDQIAEVLQLKQGLTRNQAWAGAIEALAQTGIAEPARRAKAFAHQLSGGQRQRAMIAMALACQPRLLLADEPTTALDVSLRGQILDLLGQLQRQNGMAVMLITHDLNLVRRFADRVAVMERGQIVEQGAVEAVFAQPQHNYTRQLLASRPERRLSEPRAAEPWLNARGLRVSYPVPKPGWRGWFSAGRFVAVQGADVAIAAGRTLGVVGESGSGKSTLALALLGLQPMDAGELELGQGGWSRDALANKALRRQIQVVFQDPFSSLSPRMTLEDIVGEGLRVHHPTLRPAQRRERVAEALAEVGLTEALFPGLLARYPHEFSGGQRQRIAIARALVVEPRLIVLDEPTSALDVTVQQQVLALLQRLQSERGLSYLLITHDVQVIEAMAHDVMVMKDGQVVEQGPALQVLRQPQHPYTRMLVASV
ncbi:MAG: dipeptide ABC transporter ATP-binding protein [Betaproteobacteria bacterium]